MKAIVTGAAGLIGSYVSRSLLAARWDVVGIDNDSRAEFFGSEGSTLSVASELGKNKTYLHVCSDVSDFQLMSSIVANTKPDLIVHAAAQPSHDAAAKFPALDAKTNVMGTLSMLEAMRCHARSATFIHMSTNKVYGDHPNSLPLVETESRFDYADGRDGIDETMQIQGGVHSLFGVSKLAAEAYVTEYGTNFGLKTCSLRGGCLTGAGHAAVEAHGFLAYIVKCAVTKRRYSVFGYRGKQVRDQLHASDVADLVRAIYEADLPRGSVFNIGGGRNNSASVLEVISLIRDVTGHELMFDYVEKNRTGDHLCYITDNSAIRRATGWSPKTSISESIFDIASSLI